MNTNINARNRIKKKARKARRETMCSDCKKRPWTHFEVDPFASKVHNDFTLVRLCDECYEESGLRYLE